MPVSNVARFGVSMSETLLNQFDQLVHARGYANRSEAIRDLIRDALVAREWEEGDGEVAGTITLVYDHHTAGLTDTLTELQHEYHDLIISTLHVHLDEHNCLETLIVRGSPREAKELADQLISLKGIVHGKLTVTSTGRNLK
ncbi:MAG: nickel-responsive transcriptional regulator NikR [Firmicutes bacterium]|nr:nickel-responsive transcriptional regulator NikR [Bacillota bacterium]